MYLVILDLIGWIINLYGIISKWISVIFTVLWDPFNFSKKPVYINSNLSFTIIGTDTERNRRIVTWFYRKYSEPDNDDWLDCLARFNIKSCPSHTFLLNSGESVNVNQIQLPSVFNKGVVICLICDKQKIIPITIGGLCPISIINNAIKLDK